MSKHKEGAADLYAARRQKKIRRALKRSAVFLVLALMLLLLYQKRDLWLPKLETMGAKHQTVRQGENPDGVFPMMIYGGEDFQTGSLDGRLAVLSDSYLQIFGTDGELDDARQHTYGTAMLRTAGDYALVYESGGTRFRLETAVKTRYEHSVSEHIIFGRVSEKGQVMLVTDSETGACRLYVFNEKGQQVYERSCVEELLCAEFNDDCTGCCTVSLRMVGGIMKSVVHAYSFSEKDDLWSSQPLDSLVISVYNSKDGGLFVLGDQSACWLSADGAVMSTYVYPDTLMQGECSGNRAALLLHNDEKRTDTVVILNGSGSEPVTVEYDQTAKCIRMLPDGSGVLVQKRVVLETLSSQGSVSASVAAPDGYDSFITVGEYAFLSGYDRIDRITFRT